MERKTIRKLHLTFWIFISTTTLINTSTYIGKAPFIPLFIGAFERIFFSALTFYLFYYFLSQKLFNIKSIFLLIFIILIYLPVSSVIITYIYFYPYMIYDSVPNAFEHITKNLLTNKLFYIFSGQTLFSILGILSKLSLIWYENKMKQKDIEKQNLSIELAMLRAQINPHFLFNTLNNIKSLIQRLPSKAIYSVDKLKGIMHYMLYESSVEYVPLEREIEHITNYLDLEQIRYSEPNFIDFKVSGNYSKVNIPPLLFMPFIENAFKHGEKLCPVPGVIIKLEIINPEINFEIRNYVKESSDLKKRNSGFGLINIRRRLDLLFDKKYNLGINKENKIFSVKLNIKLI